MSTETYIKSRIKRLRRRVRRRFRSPFEIRILSSPLLVHSAHHKVGTIWFANILRSVADNFDLAFFWGPQSNLTDTHEVFYNSHSLIDRKSLRRFRCSHLVRDPRDVIVSGYFYHMRTTENWALVPQEQLGGKSYQEYRKAFDKKDGLMTELKRASQTAIKNMLD